MCPLRVEVDARQQCSSETPEAPDVRCVRARRIRRAGTRWPARKSASPAERRRHKLGIEPQRRSTRRQAEAPGRACDAAIRDATRDRPTRLRCVSKIVTSNVVSDRKEAPASARCRQRQVTAPIAGSTSSGAPRFAVRLPPFARRHPPRAPESLENSARQDRRKDVAAHPSLVTTDAAQRRALRPRARGCRRYRIARDHGLCTTREPRHEGPLEAAIVDGVNQFGGGRHVHLGKHEIASTALRSTPSNCRTTADSAARPIQNPPPSSPSRYPQPPARRRVDCHPRHTRSTRFPRR